MMHIYNKRKGHSESITDIEDIEKHVVEIYNKVYSFVMGISKHFMELRCNKNKPNWRVVFIWG